MIFTKDRAEYMIGVYEWHIAQLSDISLYGPPARHVFYWQRGGRETREEALRTDLERLEFWRDVLKEKS